MQMSDVDYFDFICHIAYNQKPLTRRERADGVRRRDFLSRYSGTAREVLETLLDSYMNLGINGDAQRIEQIIWALFLKVYDAKEDDWEMEEDDYRSILPEQYRWRSWAHDDGKGTALTGTELLDFVNELFAALSTLPITPDMPRRKRIVRTMFEETNQYMKDGVLLRQVINVIDDINLESYENMHALGDIYETILKELQSAGRAGEFYTPRAVTDFMAKRIEPHLGEKMADFACGTGGFLISWLRELRKQVSTPDDIALWNASIYGIEKKQFPYMLAITNLLLHDIDNPNIDHGNSLLHDVLDYTEKNQFDKILMNLLSVIDVGTLGSTEVDQIPLSA